MLDTYLPSFLTPIFHTKDLNGIHQTLYFYRMEPQNRPKKPLRHMTDQDLVVKHFLTKKNYIQLLKEST